MPRIELHLVDGRVFDLTGFTGEAVVDLLTREGIRPGDIRQTRHILDQDVVPSIICPRCGWRSYNPHDIAERYCGHCREFHDALMDRGI